MLKLSLYRIGFSKRKRKTFHSFLSPSRVKSNTSPLFSFESISSCFQGGSLCSFVSLMIISIYLTYTLRCSVSIHLSLSTLTLPSWFRHRLLCLLLFFSLSLLIPNTSVLCMKNKNFETKNNRRVPFIRFSELILDPMQMQLFIFVFIAFVTVHSFDRK